MTYYTTKCPHCGSFIKVMSRQKYSKGVPFKKCENCGKIYTDPNCYEPALKPYKKATRASYVVSALFVSIAAAFLLFIFLINSSMQHKTVGIVVGVVFLVVLLFSNKTMQSNYDAVEENNLREWQASEERLKNPAYAIALQEAGFIVPQEFLPQKDTSQKTDPEGLET